MWAGFFGAKFMTTLHKLSARKVADLIKDATNNQGRHGDGGGLYLKIAGGSASGLYRYIRDGKERNLGLGPARDVSLAQARAKADEHRKTLDREDDLPTTNSVTFAEAAAQFLEHYRRGLRNE